MGQSAGSQSVGIVVDDPGKLWFRFADVSAVIRDGRLVLVHMKNQQVITIGTSDDEKAAETMRKIVSALEANGWVSERLPGPGDRLGDCRIRSSSNTR